VRSRATPATLRSRMVPSCYFLGGADWAGGAAGWLPPATASSAFTTSSNSVASIFAAPG